jgi:hypothetical protein
MIHIGHRSYIKENYPEMASGSTIILSPSGGKAREVKPEKTAYYHREAKWLIVRIIR